MKLRYIIAAIASAAVLAGCQTEPMVGSFADFTLDKTFVSIPLTGGSAEVAITAADAWEVTKHYDTGKKDDNKNKIYDYAPAWIKLSATAGEAGQSKLTITAEETAGGRETELQIKSGSKLQHIIVRQGTVEAVTATCKEVMEGPDANYKLRAKVTKIVNTSYGNLYLDDGTYDSFSGKNADGVYVYGTLDKDGKEKNFLSLGIEVGDVITVSGPKQTYVGSDGSVTIELVNVTVLKIEKAMLSILETKGEVTNEGGKLDFTIACKGKGAFANVSENAKEWILLSSSSFKAGVPTLFDKNPADTAYFSFKVAPNLSYDKRTGVIEFSSSNADGSTTMPYTVEQEPLALDGHLYELATEIEDGATYVLVTPSGKMMTNISANFGYPAAADANVYENWVITLSSTYNYTFEAVEGGYKIKQADDRYIYQSGTYNNFNVAAEVPEGGSPVFTVTFNEKDGTAAITNVDKEKTLGYNSSKNNFECSTSETTEHVLLYKYVRSEGSVLKEYKYKKATTLDFEGKKILFVAKKGDAYYVAIPVPSDKNYGYASGLNITDALEEDVITLKTQEYEWSIAAAGEGKYKIVLPDGRYIYQSGTYNSFQVAAADADVATVASTIVANTDGTWTITSPSGWVMRHGDGTHDTFGYYATDYAGNATLPYIYVLQEEE